jgi:D-alanyl-D-alanine carboxypeptidase/D-alanyl-D-alanine-endopeptidase (penicillin-binding protein 4)
MIERLPMLSSSIKKYIFSLVVLLLHTGCMASVQEKITQIISRKDQAKVKFGIIIIEPRSGDRIFEYNENLPLVPASNMKLITSFAAMKYLGREFKYVTTAAISDKNLIIIGSGDPLLGFVNENGMDSNSPPRFIADIIGSLIEKNITEIKDIIIDSSIFDDVRVHPNWPKEQLNRPYACEVSGLNYNANCIKISAFQKNGQIELSTKPQTSYVKLLNKIQPVSKEDSTIGSYRTETENVIIVHGKCRKAASFDVAIEKPPLFFGNLLIESLGKAGIKVSGRLSITSIGAEKLQILVEHRTGIAEVLKQCNKDSFQLAAECLFKTIGARFLTGNKAGSWQGGQKVLTDYLLSLGADAEDFNIDDGSGLSSQNKLTAGLIARVLADAYSSELWPALRDTLAAGGVDGTLKRYFNQSKYRGKVFAKTGYINSVRALSGICTAGQKEYIFSILTNDANYKTKEAIFDIVKAIIDEE